MSNFWHYSLLWKVTLLTAQHGLWVKQVYVTNVLIESLLSVRTLEDHTNFGFHGESSGASSSAPNIVSSLRCFLYHNLKIKLNSDEIKSHDPVRRVCPSLIHFNVNQPFTQRQTATCIAALQLSCQSSIPRFHLLFFFPPLRFCCVIFRENYILFFSHFVFSYGWVMQGLSLPRRGSVLGH